MNKTILYLLITLMFIFLLLLIYLGSSEIIINPKVIEKELGLMVSMWDERLSTSGAFNISSNLDIKFSEKKKNIDTKAAAFILQGALDYLNN